MNTGADRLVLPQVPRSMFNEAIDWAVPDYTLLLTYTLLPLCTYHSLLTGVPPHLSFCISPGTPCPTPSATSGSVPSSSTRHIAPSNQTPSYPVRCPAAILRCEQMPNLCLLTGAVDLCTSGLSYSDPVLSSGCRSSVLTTHYSLLATHYSLLTSSL